MSVYTWSEVDFSLKMVKAIFRTYQLGGLRSCRDWYYCRRGCMQTVFGRGILHFGVKVPSLFGCVFESYIAFLLANLFCGLRNFTQLSIGMEVGRP